MNKLLLIIALLISVLGLNAQDVTIGDLKLTITSENLAECAVSGYSGEPRGVTIPSTVTISGKEYSVTSIGKYAFEGCSSLTSIEIPSSVTFIGEYAFCFCSSLTNIELEGDSQLTSIEVSTFSGCSSLKSMEIPSGVVSIGNHAFSECSSLTNLEIPKAVAFIGTRVFLNCSSLTNIIVESGNTVYDSRNDCNALIETATNTLIRGCQNTVVPNTVITIKEYAFSGASSLTSLEIPNSVTVIERYAFSECSTLTNIEFEGDSQLTSIGECTFSDCSSLTSIEIPNSVTTIEMSAFSGCSSLTSIEIPDGVSSIEEHTFSGCNSLTSLKIPSSVTSIGTAAFSECFSLTSLEIPSSVTSIKDYAFAVCTSLTSLELPSNIFSIGEGTFYGCSSLTSLEIPNGVTSIGSYAFNECYSLTSLELPSSIISIGEGAFYFCSSLISVYCYAEKVPAIMGYELFYECPSNIVIYVPAQSVIDYKIADLWEEYTIVALPCVVTASANPEEAGIITGAGEYELSDTVTLTATANEGYRFVSWTENNNLVSIDKEYSFVVANHRNLVANFEKTYEITATVNPEKVGVIIGFGVYSQDDNVMLTAIPIKTGYEFVNWTEDGEVVSENAQYSFVATSDRDLVANFVLLDYYVSAVANAAEAGEITGSGNYNHGEDVTLTAVANEGYKFVNWTEDGEVISSVEEYSFVIIKDRDLVANFEKLEDPEEPGEGVEEYEASFNIYPNPVSDMLFIETEVEIEEVSIFDIYGRRQELSAVSCQPSAIDVSGLSSGVYFVKVVTSEGEAVKRIVKK